MSEPYASSPSPDRLADSQPSPYPFPLDGFFERHRYSPLFTGFLALLVGLIGFQVISGIAMVVFLMISGVALDRLMQDMPGVLQEYTATILMANSLGQVLGLALLAYLLARLHTSLPKPFLRLSKADPTAVGLGVLGLLALTPTVQWLGVLNEKLPLPEFIQALEASQLELLENVLKGNLHVFLALTMLAVVPALCEELFFRGYVQRQMERGMGAVAGVMASGIIFGLYHLRLSQALPLSVLGIYLAWLAWQTGSLWVPVVVHFANNALAVVLAEYVKNRPDLDISDLETMEIPWYIVLVGLAVFVLIVGFLRKGTHSQPALRNAPGFSHQ